MWVKIETKPNTVRLMLRNMFLYKYSWRNGTKRKLRYFAALRRRSFRTQRRTTLTPNRKSVDFVKHIFVNKWIFWPMEWKIISVWVPRDYKAWRSIRSRLFKGGVLNGDKLSRPSYEQGTIAGRAHRFSIAAITKCKCTYEKIER